MEVSHKSGAGTDSYGLILLGEGSPVPMVYFGIRGDRRFYVASAEESFAPALNIAIGGASDNGTEFYVDTLEIIKARDSETYEFLVNGVSLKEYASVDFAITGVGLFADGGLELEFDNFYAEDFSDNTPVKREPRKQQISVIRNCVNMGTFDLLGRRLSPASVRSFALPKAAVVYVNERGRSINVRSRKVRD